MIDHCLPYAESCCALYLVEIFGVFSNPVYLFLRKLRRPRVSAVLGPSNPATVFRGVPLVIVDTVNLEAWAVRAQHIIVKVGKGGFPKRAYVDSPSPIIQVINSSRIIAAGHHALINLSQVLSCIHLGSVGAATCFGKRILSKLYFFVLRRLFAHTSKPHPRDTPTCRDIPPSVWERGTGGGVATK